MAVDEGKAKMKRVLLTGAAGFLGREVLRQLKATDAEILAIDNYEPLCGGQMETEGAPPGVQFGDVLSPSTYAYFKATHIIHLAALGRNLTCEKHPYRAFQVNVNGTLELLEMAARTGAELIYCSSNIVLSDQATVYRMTKRTAEDLVRIYSHHGTKAMILRPSNISGKGQSRTEFQPCCFAAMDKCFEEKGYIEITGNGSQKRDFIDVKDVARAFILALDKMMPGVTLDICTGVETALKEIPTILGLSLTGKYYNPIETRYVDRRPGDALRLVSDHRPAMNALGFTRHIGTEETILDSFPAVMSAKALHSGK
jgi:UDP-glucose 4-epimerase